MTDPSRAGPDVDSAGVYFMSVEDFERRTPGRGEDTDMEHTGFWWEFMGKVGPPLFAATLVACLLSGRWELPHALLLAAAIAMMGADHARVYHKRRTRSGP